MKSKLFHSKLFEDPYIQELSLVEKLVFIYYVFNSKVNWIGTYEMSDKYVIFELGIEKELLKAIKQKFQQDKKIFFKDNWVILYNSEKYDNHMNNIQLMNSALIQFESLPKNIQKLFWEIKPVLITTKYREMFNTCIDKRVKRGDNKKDLIDKFKAFKKKEERND